MADPNDDSSVQIKFYLLGATKKVVIDITADSGDGSVADVDISGIDGFLHRLVTRPGDTAPDDNWSLALEDAESGVDVLQGLGNNQSDADALDFEVLYLGAANHPCVVPADVLTLKVSGNTVPGARMRAVLYYSVAS